MPKFSEVLKDAAVTLPSIPKNFGHGYAFGAGGWRMLGNGPDDTVFPGFMGCGDCEWAGPAHEIMELAKITGRPIPKFSGKTVVDQYSAYSGYDPHTGNNDNGSYTQEVIKWRQDKGIYDDSGTVHKIGQASYLEPGNLDQLWAGAYLFDCVGVGVQFQQAQMDQFDSQKPWDYVAGSPVEGGHYIVVPGNNGLISWGARIGWNPGWYQHLNDESYIYLSVERYNQVTGLSAEHYKDIDLSKFINLVAKQKAQA